MNPSQTNDSGNAPTPNPHQAQNTQASQLISAAIRAILASGQRQGLPPEQPEPMRILLFTPEFSQPRPPYPDPLPGYHNRLLSLFDPIIAVLRTRFPHMDVRQCYYHGNVEEDYNIRSEREENDVEAGWCIVVCCTPLEYRNHPQMLETHELIRDVQTQFAKISYEMWGIDDHYSELSDMDERFLLVDFGDTILREEELYSPTDDDDNIAGFEELLRFSAPSPRVLVPPTLEDRARMRAIGEQIAHHIESHLHAVYQEMVIEGVFYWPLEVIRRLMARSVNHWRMHFRLQQ